MKFFIRLSIGIWFIISYVNADVFDVTDKNSWLNLVKDKQYEKLDSKLQVLQDEYIQDITKERILLHALQSFDNSNAQLEYMLKDWVKAKPNSVYAHTSLGMYHLNLAFLSRGTRFINKTNEKQIAKMHAHFRKAKDEFQFAIDKNPKFTIPFAYMLHIFMANGQDNEYEAILKKALLENPYSSVIRYNHLLSLQPKWGGSLKQLKYFINETSKRYDDNEVLKRQEGYFQYVQADILRLQDNFDKNKQINYLHEAIKLNPDNASYYESRGDSYYYYFTEYQKAINDYTKALEFSPQDSSILGARSRTYLQLKQYDMALADINEALKYDSLNPRLLRIRGKIYYKTDRKSEALTDYTDSLIYENSNATAHTYLGYIYYSKKNYALASDELLKANKIKDSNAQDWYYITASQWHDRDCKFVTSAYTYKAKCEEEKGCQEKRIDWAIKSAEFAKSRGICK